MLASRDPDVVIDAVGLDAASGPWLAQRPGRTIWTLADQAPPLADRRIDATASTLAAALAEVPRAVQGCADDRGAGVRWAAGLRAHQGGDIDAARADYSAVIDDQPGFAPGPALPRAARVGRRRARGGRARPRVGARRGAGIRGGARRREPTRARAAAAGSRDRAGERRVGARSCAPRAPARARPRAAPAGRRRRRRRSVPPFVDAAAARCGDPVQPGRGAAARRRPRGRRAGLSPRQRVRPVVRRRHVQPRRAAPARRARESAAACTARSSLATRRATPHGKTSARSCARRGWSTNGPRISVASRPRAPNRCSSPCRRSRCASSRPTSRDSTATWTACARSTSARRPRRSSSTRWRSCSTCCCSSTSSRRWCTGSPRPTTRRPSRLRVPHARTARPADPAGSGSATCRQTCATT